MNEATIMRGILDRFGGIPDDNFKAWPYDKRHFFNTPKTAGVAYTVKNRAAIAVGA